MTTAWDDPRDELVWLRTELEHALASLAKMEQESTDLAIKFAEYVAKSDAELTEARREYEGPMAQEIADLRAKLETPCASHCDAWKTRAEQAEARVRRLEDTLKLQLLAHDDHLSFCREVAENRDYWFTKAEALAKESSEFHDQVRRLEEALVEVRRLLVKMWSDNPDWRKGSEHTWMGQADIVAEAALTRLTDSGSGEGRDG